MADGHIAETYIINDGFAYVDVAWNQMLDGKSQSINWKFKRGLSQKQMLGIISGDISRVLDALVH